MSVLKKLFSAGVKETVDAFGAAVDKVVTSDEERGALKNEAARIGNALAVSLARIDAKLEEEISKRHAADMLSDSRLSKNIRPLTLAFLTVAVVVLAYLTTFGLPPERAAMLQTWVDMFTELLLMVYGFYFGGRMIEKVFSMRAKSK